MFKYSIGFINGTRVSIESEIDLSKTFDFGLDTTLRNGTKIYNTKHIIDIQEIKEYSSQILKK